MIRVIRQFDLGARIGLAILVLFLIAVFIGPMISPYDELEAVGGVWESPSATHWLGTDNIGRDLLTRILSGGQVTVIVSLLATLGAFFIGCPLAITSAVIGGWFDIAVTRIIDAVMAFPGLILALIVLSAIGTSIPALVGMMAVLASTIVFRLTRAVAADSVAMDYIEVARLRGEHLGWLLFREILPNIVPTLLTEFGLRFVYAAILISSLSFLGLGIQPPFADLGGMVKENSLAITFGRMAPVMPAIALAILAIGVNLVVDGLLKHDANQDLH